MYSHVPCFQVVERMINKFRGPFPPPPEVLLICGLFILKPNSASFGRFLNLNLKNPWQTTVYNNPSSMVQKGACMSIIGGSKLQRAGRSVMEQATLSRTSW